MRQSTPPSSEGSARPADELPTSSRWRQIPEPQPLIVEESKPALPPRRMAIVAAVLLTTVSGIFLFLKNNHSRSDSPVERLHASIAPPVVVTTPSVQESPAPNPIPHHIPPAAVPVVTDDDRKIDQVLRLYTVNPAQDHTVTAQVLINLLPTLTKQGQIESARHIANLLPDSEYRRVMHIWLNAQSDRDVIEILGSDLVNRDPKIMLPAMLDALRQPSHPFHERGRQALQLFLDADYGNDFAKWEQALQQFVSPQAVAARTGGR